MIYASAVTMAMLRRRRQLAEEMMRRRARERAGGLSRAPDTHREHTYQPDYWRFIAGELRHLGGALGRVARKMRGR
jgi:hypothetical protein